MLNADYAGPGVFSQKVNEHGEIVINIDGFEFIPDLAFMNSHAVCKFCGEISCFEYFFEHVEAEKEKEKPTSGKPDKPCKIKKKDDPDVDIMKKDTPHGRKKQ
jgi:hypothetical protein